MGFTLKTPRDPHFRGSHISLGHREGLRIDLVMIHDRQIIPDFRAPDNIRLGIAPLYTSFSEIHRAVMAMAEIVTDRLYEKYETAPSDVT